MYTNVQQTLFKSNSILQLQIYAYIIVTTKWVTPTVVFTYQTSNLQGGFDFVRNAQVICLDNKGGFNTMDIQERVKLQCKAVVGHYAVNLQ